MAICWFIDSPDKIYRCEYSIDSERIKVDIEYNIISESKSRDGVYVESVNTKYPDRDIYVYDSDSKMTYLMKDAYYFGATFHYSILDGKEISTFVSYTYFNSANIDQMKSLPSTPKAKNIKLFSKIISDYNGHPSVIIKNSDSEYSIIMSKNKHTRSVHVGINNIKQISISDSWKSIAGIHSISIEMSGYIKIEFSRKVRYSEIHTYIYELMIYMQLFCPGKFQIDRSVINVDGYEFEFHTHLHKPKYTDKHVQYSTKLDLLAFLKQCYSSVPYRNGKEQFRNVPYIVMNSYVNIEDNFLMLYRFIECFYKRKQIKEFISTSIMQHYHSRKLSEEQLQNYAQEIITLRNKYVHSGYYIKGNKLNIRFNHTKGPRNYTVNMTANWILERVTLMRAIVIDIIFTEMLGINDYHYN